MRYLILMVVTLAFALPGIWAVPPVDRDEGRYVQATKQMIETGDYIDIRLQDVPRYKKPVGIYWAQSAAIHLSGQGADAPLWVYRLVSALGALITIAAVAWTGTRLFGAQAGFISALAMSATFGVVFEAHIAKTDSMLLGFTTLAMGALAQIYVARKSDAPQRRETVWIFWAAMGLGVLVKGPITPLLAALTVAALLIFDRERGWFRDLKPLRGLAVTAAIALPWFVAITWISGGSFWLESVGVDLVGKAVSGQESHGAPPGYYSITYGLYVWPFGPLFLAAGLAALNHLRADPRLLFIACWYIPFWLLYEMLPTKLPHYVLPVYPALALLVGWAFAGAVDLSPAVLRRWQRWLLWFSVAGQIALSLVLALGAMAGPVYLGDGFRVSGIFAAIAIVVAGTFGALAIRRMRLREIAYTLGAAAIAYAIVFADIVPSMTRIWMSPRIASAIEIASSCESTQLASVRFHEPSLVFLTDTETLLTNVEGAANHLIGDPACALALVPDNESVALRDLAAAAGHDLRMVALIEGVNYSKGHDLAMQLFKVAN